MSGPERHDVVIFGAGLAGLTLARHLLRTTDKTVLLVDRLDRLPGPRQKVGEATVQVSGYYLSKVLDLEEHLLRDHFMKYNLRFFWKTPGRANDAYEDYGQAYIRPLSNIASYQLDRNRLEAELLRLNGEDPRFTFRAPVADVEVDLAEDEAPHEVRFAYECTTVELACDWVVDATGRGKLLAKRMGLRRKNAIRHGTSFLWVDGLLNVEKLTGMTAREIRLNPQRSATGHLPVWLATNHFMGDGFWFWTIPLQGKTSLGLVYDVDKVPRERVATPEKLVEWICAEFPLFARDLPGRRIVDWGGYRDFSYDCAKTLGNRWALSGEAGRFSDPLYSPGGDLISFHNTAIADLIATADRAERTAKTRTYESLLRAVYEAYVPSFSVGYDLLADAEAFVMKYAWELTVYFAYYVFPFINDLFTDRRFVGSFLARFGRLGPINAGVMEFLRDYRRWKEAAGLAAPAEPRFVDFMAVGPLAAAEKTFYRVGVGPAEAREVLNAQLGNLERLVRWIGAHVAAVVLGDERVLTDRAFVEDIDPVEMRFDPDEMARRWAAVYGSRGSYEWGFDPAVLADLRPQRPAEITAGRPRARRRKGEDRPVVDAAPATRPARRRRAAAPAAAAERG